MRARNTGPRSAAFLSPTPLMRRNSSGVRGLRAAISASVRSLKIRYGGRPRSRASSPPQLAQLVEQPLV